MYLKNLPLELLLMLANDYVYPDDIEAFSTTCRGLYDVARSRLRKHIELKRSLSALAVDCQNLSNAGANWQKLYECCSNPWTARYPKSLRLTSQSRANPAYSERDMSERLRALAPYNEFFSLEDINSWDLSDRAGLDAMTALCLCFLPNLQTIELDYRDTSRRSTQFGLVKLVLDRVASCSRPSRNHRGHLMQLNYVKATANHSETSLNWIHPFLDLPSVRIIEGQRMEVLHLQEPPSIDPPRISKVTSIMVNECSIRASAFSSILPRIECLRNFNYTHGHRPGGPYHACNSTSPRLNTTEWDGGERQRIINTLLQHAMATLETLQLEFSCRDCTGPIMHLSYFQSLISLTLSASLLLNKDGSYVDLSELLPLSIEYLKVTKQPPDAATQRLAYQKQQTELLATLPRIREKYAAQLRYQTLSIFKLDDSGFGSCGEARQTYTLHPGPGGAIRALKPFEYLEWMECGEDPGLTI